METVKDVLDEIINNKELTIAEILELAKKGRVMLMELAQEVNRIEKAIFKKET